MDDVWFCVFFYAIDVVDCVPANENKSRLSEVINSIREWDWRSIVRQFGHLIGLRDIVNLVNSFHFLVFVFSVI